MPRANIQHTERAEQVTTETINFNFPKTENKSLHNLLKKRILGRCHHWCTIGDLRCNLIRNPNISAFHWRLQEL